MKSINEGKLIVVGGRPAMGKTGFALSIARETAFKQNKTVAIFSLEMSKEQLEKRLLSMGLNVDAQNIGTGQSNIIIDDTPGIDIAEFCSKCRKYKRENELSLIIVDYLQLMSGNGCSKTRQQEISEVADSMKEIAGELGVPVVVLCQMGRSVEEGENKRPVLSDLRESGCIQDIADIILFIYREDYYKCNESEKKNTAEIIVAKNYNGETGIVEVGFEEGRFFEKSPAFIP